MTPAETANEALVTRFCADWAKRDAELLAGYFTDPFEYMIYEGGPVIRSREEFVRRLGPYLAGLREVDWEILRSHAMGPMVVNERIDHFYAPEGGKDHHPRIVGLFIVRDGRIAVWRDYNP